MLRQSMFSKFPDQVKSSSQDSNKKEGKYSWNISQNFFWAGFCHL